MRVRFFSELIGTAFLLKVVVGSGIMAQNLFPGQTGAALLANSIATGAGLFVLIQSLGPVSGAHFNPVVSLIEFLWKRLTGRELILYILAQLVGAYFGTLLTHVMFNESIFQISSNERTGLNLMVSEAVATFGLISVIALSGRKHVEFAPLSISAYIVAAYWFTSSTSFANPAVTLGRIFTDTFTGIAPNGVLLFWGAQVVGALFSWWLVGKVRVEDQNPAR